MNRPDTTRNCTVSTGTSPTCRPTKHSASWQSWAATELFYNRVMWVSQEPGAVIEKPARRQWSRASRREPCLSQSNPRPVTLTGNYVGYRWLFDNARQRRAFLKQYVDAPDESAMSHALSVAVPTGGVFGEAVLGQAVSAEKIDLTRFWKWQDSPIPILPSQISPLQAGGLARDVNTSTGQLNESAAKLDQMAALPDPAGFSAASQMMTSNIFRDMSGSDVVKELALAATAPRQTAPTTRRNRDSEPRLVHEPHEGTRPDGHAAGRNGIEPRWEECNLTPRRRRRRNFRP